MSKIKLLRAAFLIIAIALTVVVYSEGLSGPFLFDDFPNIVGNESLKIHALNGDSILWAMGSGHSGPLGRPISMLTFALDYLGEIKVVRPAPSAHPFKITNLIIHILCGILLYGFLLLLTDAMQKRLEGYRIRYHSEWMPAGVTLLWMLHPLNLTSVLYVVQRMTSLATLFCLAGMGFYIWCRQRLETGGQGSKVMLALGAFIFTGLAALSKENGILLIAYLLLIEVCVFNFKNTDGRLNHFIIALHVIAVGVPLVMAIVYAQHSLDVLQIGYLKRDFNMAERLMTESRVIWLYLRLLMLPDIAMFGIFHDDLSISRSLLQPASTLPAIIGVAILLLLSIRLYRQHRIYAFALLFFLLGHSMESTVLPLELVHEHRNYLPGIGILLAIVHLAMDRQVLPNTLVWRRVAVFALATLFAGITFSRANDWSTPYNMWSSEVRHHPESIRSLNELAALYANENTPGNSTTGIYYKMAIENYQAILVLDRYNTSALFGLIQLNKRYARSPEDSWLQDLKYALKTRVIPSNTNANLLQFANCLSEKNCPWTVAVVNEIIYAPLENAKVVGRDRALIYSVIASYSGFILNDYENALQYIDRAIALSPDVEDAIAKVRILIRMRDFAGARVALNELKTMDHGTVRKDDVADLESDIDSFQQRVIK